MSSSDTGSPHKASGPSGAELAPPVPPARSLALTKKDSRS